MLLLTPFFFFFQRKLKANVLHHWVFKDMVFPTTSRLIVYLKMGKGYGVPILGDTQNPSGDGAEHPVPPDPGWSRGAAEAHSHLGDSGLVRNNMFLL